MNVNIRPDSEFVLAPWSKPRAIERAVALTQQIERGDVTLEVIVQRSVLQALFEGEFLQKEAPSESMIDYVSALSRHHGIPSDLADVVRIHDECISHYRDLLSERAAVCISAVQNTPQKKTIIYVNSGITPVLCERVKQLPEEGALATDEQWIELCMLTLLANNKQLTIKPRDTELMQFILARPGMNRVKIDRTISQLLEAWTSLNWIDKREVATEVQPDDIDDYL